jgi:hypothetical protein
MSMADEIYAVLTEDPGTWLNYDSLGKIIPGFQTLNPRGIYEFTVEGIAALDELRDSGLAIMNFGSTRLNPDAARTKVRRKIEDLIRKDKGVLDKVANFLNIK